LLADRGDGVEARHRLLKDHADSGTADGTHIGHGQRQEVATLEGDARARLDAAGLGNQAHRGECRHGFAGARFSNQRQRLALRD